MRTGIFTDPHYSSAEVTCGKRFNSRSLEKIKAAYEYFRSRGCGRVMILGDITDTEPTHEAETENLRRVRGVFDAYPDMATVCLMGNHDAFTCTREEFYGVIGENRMPRVIGSEKASLVFIDACWFSDGRRYMPGDSNWRDAFCPHTAGLKDTLEALAGDVYVFMHQNIDPHVPEDHRLSNAAEVRRILEDSRKVRCVYQGHYHPGHESEVNGIRYVTLSAMCENDGAYIVAEL